MEAHNTRGGLGSSLRRRYYLGRYFPNIYLTQREADCGVLLLDNLSNITIGYRLGLSDRTVEFYISNIKRKLHVRKRADLMRLLCLSNLLSLYKRFN